MYLKHWYYSYVIVITLSDEGSSKEIMKIATESVGSLSDTEFSIAFNPDLFQPHVKHAQPDVRSFKSVYYFTCLS